MCHGSIYRRLEIKYIPYVDARATTTIPAEAELKNDFKNASTPSFRLKSRVPPVKA
jgi:hypothetical protein